MNQHQRTNDAVPQPAEGSPENPGANLNALRQQAAALHAAADEAIKRVLSANSSAFNAAMRQEGGQ